MNHERVLNYCNSHKNQMTNCNYSEHTKIQKKEIQKQIEELQAKLEELEQQKSPVEIAFKDNYGVYPDELKSNNDFNCWVSFKRGYIAAKREKVEEPEEGTWDYDPDAKFRKQEEVKKLQEKDWNVVVKTNLKPHWAPIPQEPEEVAEGLKEAFKEAVKQGVVPSNTKPQTLYDVIADWWDEIFTNGNPSGQNIESLVEQIVKLLPHEVNEPSACDDWDIAWNQGFNAYRDILMKKFNGK